MWKYWNPKRKAAVKKDEDPEGSVKDLNCKDYQLEISAATKEKFDVVLKVDGKSFELHRNVLAASSNYFKRMFSIEMKEREITKITMQEIESSVFKTLVDFMYTGEVKISKKNAYKLWITSDYLEINDISIMAKNVLIEQLKKEIRSEKHNRSFYDVLEIRYRANLLQCKQLFTTTNKFIAINLKDFSNSDEFKSMNYNQFIDFIKSDDIIEHCTKESTFEACMSWIQHDEEQRLPKKEELLARICSRDYNPRKIFVYGSYGGSFEIYDLIKEQWNKAEDSPRQLYLMGDSLVLDSFYFTANKIWSQMNAFATQKTHSAVVMLEDIIYFCGGRGFSGDAVNDVECYHTTRNIWQPLAPMIEMRKYACAVALNGYIYVMGGVKDLFSPELSSVERYDPNKNCWNLVAPMLNPKSFFKALVLNGKIYIHRFEFDNFECYDPTANSWHVLPPMAKSQSFACTVAFNGFIYVLGCKYDKNKILNSVERYDPEKNCWGSVKPMINKRLEIQATIFQGKIYVCGGFDENNESLNLVEMYDPTQDSWAEAPSMISKRGYFALLSAGKIFAIGGISNKNESINDLLDSVEIYDPKTEAWTLGDSMLSKGRREFIASV